MFSKSNLLATLAGFFVMYLLGWAFYGGLAEGFFTSHTILKNLSKPPSGSAAGLIAIGSLIIAFTMSTLYGKWSRGHHSLQEGFKFGALLGVLIGFGIGIIIYATSNFMDSTGQLVDAVWNVIYYGIAGMAIAFVYKQTAT